MEDLEQVRVVEVETGTVSRRYFRVRKNEKGDIWVWKFGEWVKARRGTDGVLEVPILWKRRVNGTKHVIRTKG